jgi:arylsulfatase A-like enzyme
LQPNQPHDASALADVTKLHNHYANSVALQERTVASFLRELGAMPSWENTVVLFVSDHGEEFREHGGLYHLTNLFDEQLRVPGWLAAGPLALDDAQRASLAGYARRRTYSQDVHATLLDLFGVLDLRTSFPFAGRVTGRSLMRPPPAGEPAVLLSTASGVWGEPDDPKFGVMQGDILAVRSVKTGWLCFDAAQDPKQTRPTEIARCGALLEVGQRGFAASFR